MFPSEESGVILLLPTPSPPLHHALVTDTRILPAAPDYICTDGWEHTHAHAHKHTRMFALIQMAGTPVIYRK